jgi:hypothetical protein
LPSVQQQKGFRNVRLLGDRTNGRIAWLGSWETKADFQVTVEWDQEQLARFALRGNILINAFGLALWER